MRKPKNLSLEIPLKGLEVFMADFIISRFEDLVEVKAALSQKDFTSITKMAHKWRGISAPYGFGELAVLATEIEECVETYQTHLCQGIVDEVEEYLNSKSGPDNAGGP